MPAADAGTTGDAGTTDARPDSGGSTTACEVFTGSVQVSAGCTVNISDDPSSNHTGILVQSADPVTGATAGFSITALGTPTTNSSTGFITYTGAHGSYTGTLVNQNSADGGPQADVNLSISF
jgi:hypothetical protein